MNPAALEHTQDQFRPENEPNLEKLVVPIAGDVIVIHDKCVPSGGKKLNLPNPFLFTP